MPKHAGMPGPVLNHKITLRKQLVMYEQYLACESIDAVAKANKLSPEVTAAIIARVPRDMLTVAQMRTARATMEMEEMAAVALLELRKLFKAGALEPKDIIAVLNITGAHLGKLLSVNTPQVQQNTFEIGADELLEAIRRADSRNKTIHSGGNSNRLPDMQG